MQSYVLLCLAFALPLAIYGHSSTSRFTRNDNPDGPVDYSQHKVIRILPNSLKHVPKLRQLEEEFEMDYWNPVFQDLRPVLTIIDPQRSEFLTALNRSRIPYEVLHQNYQKVVDAEKREMVAARFRESRTRGFNFNEDYDYENSYHTYAEILNQLQFLANKYPSNAVYSVIGKSYEGRDIPALTIGTGSKVLVIECGIHSREWVTQAFGTWLANYLLSQASLASYLTQYKFVIVPMLNVDGFVFTHTNTRLWRKTRSRLSSSTCYGADPNRNWDAAWGQTGASSNPCSETYYGVRAFSEVEAKAMADVITSYGSNVAAYFAVHSYSQLWMYPWGYKTALPPNNAKLKSLSQAAVTAIKGVNGLDFVEGTIANAIYVSSGSSVDWAYDVAGVPINFALELRDKGQYGFQLPASQIRPAVYETWAGLKATIDNL